MNQARTQIPTKSAGRSDTRFFFMTAKEQKSKDILLLTLLAGTNPAAKMSLTSYIMGRSIELR